MRLKTTAIAAVLVAALAVTGAAAPPPSDAPAAEEGQAPSFDVANLTVDLDGPVVVTAEITNPGDEPMIQDVELRVDGEVIERRPFALNPNETETITFETDEGNVSDAEVLSVLTRDHGEVTVLEESEEPEEPTARVTFPDQTSDGSTVMVAQAANETAPFYVAVWTVVDGEPDDLLGAAHVDATEASNASVTLDPPLTENGTLVAAVHPDADGDASTSDDPVTDRILASDTAEVTVENDTDTEEPTAEVSFENQTSNGTTVVVDSVTLSEGGFVAIHNDSLLDGDAVGSVVGVSTYLSAGTHENVTVTLFDIPGATYGNDTLTENQTLIAMPHLDTDGDQSYDFVATDGAEDGPYVADGAAVTDDAEVTVEADGAEEPEGPAASVAFEDQESNGSTVTVANATNGTAPFYVAVWTVVDGEPDDLLGAAHVNATEASNASVTLDPPLTENGTLVAAVHPDADGNASTSDDPVTDRVLASDTAEIIAEQGEDGGNDTGEPSATVTFADQTSNGTTVVVDSVTLSEGGFVAIHNDSLLDGFTVESVVGVSEYLPAGTHGDVTVTLFDVPGATYGNDSLAESQPLIAMPHLDTDGDRSYGFVATDGAEDGPYLADGAAVTDEAQVTVENETA